MPESLHEFDERSKESVASVLSEATLCSQMLPAGVFPPLGTLGCGKLLCMPRLSRLSVGCLRVAQEARLADLRG